MTNLKTLAASIAIILATGAAAQAATMDFSQGQTESNSAILHAEGQNVTVQDGTLFADYVVGSNLSVGDSFGGVSQANSSLAVAGGVYSSHLIHFDPLGSVGGRASGTFDFVGRIVAIIVSNGSGSGNNNNNTAQLLNDSDALFSSDIYEQSLSRRSENSDRFTLIDENTLSFNFRTSNGFIDNVRVVTAVPLPASALMMLGGLAAIGAIRARRRRRV